MDTFDAAIDGAIESKQNPKKSAAEVPSDSQNHSSDSQNHSSDSQNHSSGGQDKSDLGEEDAVSSRKLKYAPLQYQVC